MPEYQSHTAHAAEEAARTHTDAAGRAGEYVTGQVRAATEETSRLAGEIAAAVRERPYTTIAVAAGLAFAFGALWKMRTGRQQSNLDALLARLPDLPSRNSLLPRAWR